jgi:plasmid stabilization system protein ParE
MKVVYTEEAHKDLDAIADWLTRHCERSEAIHSP